MRDHPYPARTIMKSRLERRQNRLITVVSMHLDVPGPRIPNLPRNAEVARQFHDVRAKSHALNLPPNPDLPRRHQFILAELCYPDSQ